MCHIKGSIQSHFKGHKFANEVAQNTNLALGRF